VTAVRIQKVAVLRLRSWRARLRATSVRTLVMDMVAAIRSPTGERAASGMGRGIIL
jgi:hypothetical protein